MHPARFFFNAYRDFRPFRRRKKIARVGTTITTNQISTVRFMRQF
jgi:hypothetical protein